ncbi:retrovirus-related pol polyprotein from transposon TNT 1-94 [Tanacetum coccineum]
MKAGTTSTTLGARLPILNLGEYDLWLKRIEQYFLMTHYPLWEVILNGNKVLKRNVGEVEQEYEPTSVEEKHDRRNEMKARGTLLMALLNKDQLKFHSFKDAKLLMEAIEKRYGGNKESKKVQRTLLKQQYKNFSGSSSETIDQTFDRLQKLISQLEIQGERNKEEIETISLDDFTNSNNNNCTNEEDNTAFGVSAAHTQSNPIFGDNLSDAVICAFLASQPNSPQLAQEDLEQINPDDLEEMDLQWEMTMLTIRARRFIKRTCRKLDVNGQRVGFDRSKVECYNCHKNGHFARECRLSRNQEKRGKENYRRIMTVETPTENALVAQDRIGGDVKKVVSNHKSADVKNKGVEPQTVRKNSFIPPIIEDWNSDNESKVDYIPNVEDKTVRPSTKKIKFVKSARETVEKIETSKQNKHYPRGNQRNWNNLMS